MILRRRKTPLTVTRFLVNGYGHMEHPVNLNADIQGMNRYFGWYEKKLQDIEPWVEGLEKNYPDQKLC